MENNLKAYLWCMAAGWTLCVILYYVLTKRKTGAGKALRAAGSAWILSPVFGLVFAKLCYMLLRFNIIPHGEDFFPYLTDIRVEELCFSGAVIGVILSICLSSRIAGIQTRQALNCFAPAGALMAAVARMSEMHLGMLGVGMYLEEGFFPFAQPIVWDNWTEWYLAVFTLEAFFALIAMVLSLIRKDEPWCFLRTLFYLCLPQVFCESLRMNTIAWLFVKSEQVICFAVCEGILVWAALKTDYRKIRHWVPVLIGFIVLLLTIAEEFALDKTDIPHWITYGLMLIGLGAMALAEHKSQKLLGVSFRGGSHSEKQKGSE